MLRTESEHDCYGAGHAGTALSAGARAWRRGATSAAATRTSSCVAGDAAFTCGVSTRRSTTSTEATKKFIVVLNDNEWSIAKNVGAMAGYFNRIATSPTYQHLHEKAAPLHPDDRRQGRAQDSRARWRRGLKNVLLPSVLFEDLGPALLRPHRRARHGAAHPHLRVPQDAGRAGHPPHPHQEGQRATRPRCKQPDKFHGLGKYKLETGETAKAPLPTYSEILGDTLANFADSNSKIVAITGAMPSGTGLGRFQKRHPKKYYDVGIAEEHAALFACGLGGAGDEAVPGDLLDVHAARLRHDHPRHGAAKPQRAPVHGPRRAERRRRPDAPRPLRHRLPAPRARTWCSCSPRTRTSSRTCSGRWPITTPGPIAIRYPRGAGTGREAQAAAEAAGDRQGGGRASRQGRDRAARGALRPGRHVHDGRGSRRPAGSAGHQRGGRSTRVGSSRWTPGTLEFFARSAEVVCTLEDHVLHQRLRLRGDGASQRGAHPGAGGAAGLGPISSSSTATIPVLREKHGLTAKALVARVLPLAQEKGAGSHRAPAAAGRCGVELRGRVRSPPQAVANKVGMALRASP